MAERVLVTGGLGFIGAALTRRLVDAGHEVRILDNGLRASVERLGEYRARVRIFDADVRDGPAVSEAARECSMVCHLAYVNGTRFFYEKPAETLEVGVKGMINVLDACRQHGVQQLMLASSSEVYQTPPLIPTPEEVPLVVPQLGNPRYSYGGGKIISELLAVHLGASYMKRVVIFRPHNVYGPAMGWDHVIPELAVRIYRATRGAGRARGEVALLGDGRQTRAFVYIDDFIDGVFRLVERGRHLEVYHIGSSEELRIAEVAQGIAAHLGVQIDLVAGAAPAGEAARRVPDIGKMQSLGYRPQVDFRTGLAKTIDWYVAHLDQAPKGAA